MTRHRRNCSEVRNRVGFAFFRLNAELVGRQSRSRCVCKQDPEDSISHFRSSCPGAQLVFPYPKYANSPFPQQSGYLLSPPPVARYFGAPVRSVGLGEPKAFGTSVPETPIHEYCNGLFGKPKIWAPWNGLRVHLPSAYSRSHKNESQSPFGGAVAGRSDLRHQGASVVSCQSVHTPDSGDNR